jgi:hypothetical protein
MDDPFTDELDPFEVTVAASIVAERAGSTIIGAILENGTGADGGEVELEITHSARSAYGVGTCISEFERWINSTLGPDFRLGAVLTMAEHGAFMVVRGRNAGPRVIDPATRARLDLAA